MSDPHIPRPSFRAGRLFFAAVPLLFSSCTLLPSFSTPPPPLLLRQEPERPPLFVLHLPERTPQTIFFSGHAHKAMSPEKARAKALDLAFNAFGNFLASQGYPLTSEEARRWLRESPAGGPRVTDSWLRTYIQSPDRPYIHLTSIYLLLSVPVAYLHTLTDALAKEDRASERGLSRRLSSERKELSRGDGARGLRDLRRALELSRRIHTLDSFPKKLRPKVLRERETAAHLWRKALRETRLTLRPSVLPLVLKERPAPPARLDEEARIRRNGGIKGLSGLAFRGSLLPLTLPEPLVFPPLAGIFRNPKTPFDAGTLLWETHLLRLPPYRKVLPLEMDCTPTTARGTGTCHILKIHIPGRHGVIEGSFRPVAGSPLDRPVFQRLFDKTLIDVHFRFHHRRRLHPLLLVLSKTIGPEEQKAARKALVTALSAAGITLCFNPGGGPSCQDAPRGLTLPSPENRLVFDPVRIERRTSVHPDFSVTTVQIRTTVRIDDGNGLIAALTFAVQEKGFEEASALREAWNGVGQRLARLLPMIYYPTRSLHPGVSFYDQ